MTDNELFDLLRAAGLTVGEPYQYMGRADPYNRVVDITDSAGNTQQAAMCLLHHVASKDPSRLVVCVEVEAKMGGELANERLGVL